jgi:hypothetical protein
MTGEGLAGMLAAHLRGERAVAAPRRFISRNINATVRRSDVVEFLRRRRDPRATTRRRPTMLGMRRD